MRRIILLWLFFVTVLFADGQSKANKMILVRAIGTCDVAVIGTIISIDSTDFRLVVIDVLKGHPSKDTLTIYKERICKNYASYKTGTTAAYFLFEAHPHYYLKGRGKTIFHQTGNTEFYSPIAGECTLYDLKSIIGNFLNYFEFKKGSNNIFTRVDKKSLEKFASMSKLHTFIVSSVEKIQSEYKKEGI